jgi:hypothetical protein
LIGLLLVGNVVFHLESMRPGGSNASECASVSERLSCSSPSSAGASSLAPSHYATAMLALIASVLHAIRLALVRSSYVS